MGNFNALVISALKILSDTVFQNPCLTHIYDLILFIVHEINTGFCRQFFQFFLNIKIHNVLHF